MKSTKEILSFYFIILLILIYPVTEAIEICRIGGKQHICGKSENNSGYIDNINVKYSLHVQPSLGQKVILACIFKLQIQGFCMINLMVIMK